MKKEKTREKQKESSEKPNFNSRSAHASSRSRVRGRFVKKHNVALDSTAQSPAALPSIHNSLSLFQRRDIKLDAVDTSPSLPVLS